MSAAGVFMLRILRGLLLSSSATSVSRSLLCTARSVPFGKYWRTSPFGERSGAAMLSRRVEPPSHPVDTVPDVDTVLHKVPWRRGSVVDGLD
jgi:hypothetical protein